VDFAIVPMTFALGRFMSDPRFIQQCFVTNEPFYAQKNGEPVKTLLISDSGYDPYRVLTANADFVAAHPRETRAFVQASIRGWNDYLHGDPSPADRIIEATNPQMTPDFVAYSRAALLRYRLVEGDPAKGETTGKLTRARLERQLDELRQLKLLDRPITVDEAVKFGFFEPGPNALR
jgi:NitT/TauT family transport system substrate-binding protein